MIIPTSSNLRIDSIRLDRYHRLGIMESLTPVGRRLLHNSIEIWNMENSLTSVDAYSELVGEILFDVGASCSMGVELSSHVVNGKTQ